ncbi:MAG: peptidase [Gemmatimonadota bacterium]
MRIPLLRIPGRLTMALLVSGGAGCTPGDQARDSQVAGLDAEHVAAQLAKFVPTTLSFDESLLDDRQKAVLKSLIQASDHLDMIFQLQAWRGNADPGAVLPANLEAASMYYDIMYGPWDRLEDDAPFLDVGPKPLGAGYYPEDLTREEFEEWVTAHPEDDAAFTSYYTVIERTEDGGLTAVPYNEAYREHLVAAADLLRDAASSADNKSLRHFLELRAESLLSDEYFDSEVAWMRLGDNLIEPTLGPYEVYEDKLFGYKAAYESFITLKDPKETAELEGLAAHLPDLEAALPIPDEHKYLDRPFTSPISVVTQVYVAGDTRSGVQTIAFNLPNDARVREEEGSKKVMLRNVIDAKFEQILKPIARVVLVPEQAERISVEPYFTRVLMHELAHGLGPDYVTGQPDLTVNKGLRDKYSRIEEAKADAVGTHSLRILTERGVYTQDFLEEVYIDHVADMFRCVRFGVGEAHGMGCLTQFNFLREQAAITHDPETGKFAADLQVMPSAMAELARHYLLLEATADYDGAVAFIEQYGKISPEMQEALDRLEAVPTDIIPVFPVKEMMKDW